MKFTPTTKAINQNEYCNKK